MRAIAGLWTRGEGTIQVPPARQVMFVPARPYLPLTTLRAAITYPDDATYFDDSAVHTALNRVGLEHLAPRLFFVLALGAPRHHQRVASGRTLHHIHRAHLVEGHPLNAGGPGRPPQPLQPQPLGGEVQHEAAPAELSFELEREAHQGHRHHGQRQRHGAQPLVAPEEHPHHRARRA